MFSLKNAKQRTASESSLELKAHLHILYIKQKIKIHLTLKNLELIHIQMHTLLTNMIFFFLIQAFSTSHLYMRNHVHVCASLKASGKYCVIITVQ